MNLALVSIAMFGMWHFTGSVPQELSGYAYEHSELPQASHALEQRLPASLKLWGGNVALLAKTAYEQKLVYEWRF